MKCYAVLALLVSCACAAPTNSLGASANVNGANANGRVEMKVKGVKAALYLFAPESWISAWDAIPEDGQICFLKAASDPANAALYNSDNTDKIKEDLQAKCPTAATQLAAFSDLTSQTVKSLPASFLEDSKAWGLEMQALGEKFKDSAKNAIANAQQNGQVAVSNAQQNGQQNAALMKQYIAEFANSTAAFTNKVAALSQADRDQISAAFPKLQPFFSGDHAVEFLNEVSDLYETLGTGIFDPAALKTQGEQLKDTLKIVWEQYKAGNADGLRQAGALMGKDLTNAGNAFNMQAGAQANFGTKNTFAESHPELVNTLNEGKQKLAEGKEKFQAFLQNAKESGSEHLNELKENGKQNWEQIKQAGQERFNELKQKAQEWKGNLNQQHSVDAGASVGGNGASANLAVN